MNFMNKYPSREGCHQQRLFPGLQMNLPRQRPKKWSSGSAMESATCGIQQNSWRKAFYESSDQYNNQAHPGRHPIATRKPFFILTPPAIFDTNKINLHIGNL
jgi:hypothetical protein